jgi:NitT/TauT family transport system permease protein
VLAAGWALAQNGQLWEHTSISLARSLGGLVLAIVFAIPLGLAIGWYQRLGNALNPLIELLRNTAPLALLPVFLLLLGIGEVSKLSIVVYACAWPLLLNTISAVRQVDPLLVKSARTMGASSRQLFLKVILPASVPTIFVGIRLAAASAMLVRQGRAGLPDHLRPVQLPDRRHVLRDHRHHRHRRHRELRA